MHLIFSKASTCTSRVDIMTRKANDGQVGHSSTRATGYFRWEDWVVPGASKKWRMIGQVPRVMSVSMSSSNRCQSMNDFVWLSIGHRLTDTNRYQLTNFIDWYQLIAWFSDHRFPSIGYPVCTAPQMIPDRKWSPDRKWYSNWTANGPEPHMIPDVDRKRSRRKTRNGVEFVPRDVVSIFNTNRRKSWLTLFYTDILNFYDIEFYG